MYNNDLNDFSFRNNSGTAQYSMDDGSTWVNFKNPTGTKSITANGTYDVTDYASVSVNVKPSEYANVFCSWGGAWGAFIHSNGTTAFASRSSGSISQGKFTCGLDGSNNFYINAVSSGTYFVIANESLAGGATPVENKFSFVTVSTGGTIASFNGANKNTNIVALKLN